VSNIVGINELKIKKQTISLCMCIKSGDKQNVISSPLNY